MAQGRIPVSVGILTLNSASWLAPTLENLSDFSDVYICDGNSTDGTQELARSMGVRVEKQFDNDEPNQRIKSFGEARTRCMSFAKEPWSLRVDSDELVSQELKDEVRRIASSENPEFFAYKISRKYLWKGKVIDRCITYPNWQPRFFHRSVLLGYSKATHERPELVPGIAYGRLKQAQLVPLPDEYAAFWKKFENGLYFDKIQHKNVSLYSWIYGTVHTAAWLLIYSWRLFWSRVLPGNKLPLEFEFARFKYLAKVWMLTTRFFFKKPTV